ncbi:MAG TPA: hypothetical protein VM283_01415 [Armatimonadota bacterium]|nr:hypothetical protein [Armatimonadota bacterium]
MTPPEGGELDLLRWRSRRCAERPWLCALVIVFELALSFGVYIVYGPWYAALVLVFLTGALASYYGEFEHMLDADGVTVRGPLGTARHRWEEFKGFEVIGEDVRLRFREPRRPADLVLHTPGRTEQVVAYIGGRIAR